MDLPHINQRVEFKVTRGLFRHTYVTYVEDADDQTLVVAHPMAGSAPAPLKPGDSVRIEFAVPDQARAGLVAQVLRLEDRMVPVVVLRLPDARQVQRVQQRDFVRLDASLSLLYTVVHWPRNPERQGETYRGRTRDISGGGAQILCTEAYPPGTQLDIDLELPGQVVNVLGEVIRDVERLRSGEHWVGVRFVNVSETTREALIRYIFDEQRERRRRGLL